MSLLLLLFLVVIASGRRRLAVLSAAFAMREVERRNERLDCPYNETIIESFLPAEGWRTDNTGFIASRICSISRSMKKRYDRCRESFFTNNIARVGIHVETNRQTT